MQKQDQTINQKALNHSSDLQSQIMSNNQSFLKNTLKEFENILYLFQNSLNKDLSLHTDQEKTKDKMIQKIIHKNSSPKHKQRILSEFCGFGPLDPLLHDSDITEIIINGKDHVFYEKYGTILQLHDLFLSKITFHNIIEKINTKARLTVNFKKPFNEGKWGPFRVVILCPPIVKQDFHICLRRHTKSVWTFKALKEKNWAPNEAIDIIKQFIKERLNFLIVGATSSGKTSVLNACLQETNYLERIISIEDTDEILLPNKASTKLLTKNDPENAKPLIDQQNLLQQSLRLRPDRIVMGEVRGKEAKDLLLALSTGHKGSIGTLHSSNHKQAIWKLELLSQMGSPKWQSSTIRKLIFSSLNGLIVLEKKQELRLLKGIYKITGLESSGFLFETLFERKV